jgi:hypothetical protein
MTRPSWRQRFVRSVYADQNDSPSVRAALARVLDELGSGRGINVGGGPRRLDPRLVHIDVVRHAACDCLGDARRLPFASGVFDLAVSQETVEHVDDPFLAVRNGSSGASGVESPAGAFVIGYHPAARLLEIHAEGVTVLLAQAGVPSAEVEIAVGPATGCYRLP